MENKKENYCEVSNKEELLDKMKKKKEYILIKGKLNEDVKKLLKTTLSDEETMGLELGSAGAIGIPAEILYQIITYFKNKSNIDKKLESTIRQYKFRMEKENILLYHKQLDY